MTLRDSGSGRYTFNGVRISNLVCGNDHGNSGQIMEPRGDGGYECPECGRTAAYHLEWSDPDE